MLLDMDYALLDTAGNLNVQLLPLDTEVRFSFGNLDVTILGAAKDPIDPNMFYVEHCHDGYELRFVESGLGYTNISGIDIAVSKNDMYIVSPKVMHRRRSDSKNPLVEYCFKFDLRLRCNSNNCDPEERRLLEVLSNPYPYVFSLTDSVQNTLCSLIENFIDKPPCYMLYAKTIFMELIVKVYRVILSHRQVDEEPLLYPEEVSLQQARMRKIADYVELNLNNNISIHNLAGILKLSPRQINRTMSKYFGMTFSEYLENYKFDIAKELLRQTYRPVSDIAFMSGFTNPQQMYRLFKSRLHCSPNQFREQKQMD